MGSGYLLPLPSRHRPMPSCTCPAPRAPLHAARAPLHAARAPLHAARAPLHAARAQGPSASLLVPAPRDTRACPAHPRQPGLPSKLSTRPQTVFATCITIRHPQRRLSCARSNTDCLALHARQLTPDSSGVSSPPCLQDSRYREAGGVRPRTTLLRTQAQDSLCARTTGTPLE